MLQELVIVMLYIFTAFWAFIWVVEIMFGTEAIACFAMMVATYSVLLHVKHLAKS